MQFCASAYQVIQEMTNTTRKSGEQHIEIGLSRIIAIGKIHVLLLNSCTKEIHVFCMKEIHVFCNIAIGVYTYPSVNCDNAQAICESTLEKMVGVKVSEFLVACTRLYTPLCQSVGWSVLILLFLSILFL